MWQQRVGNMWSEIAKHIPGKSGQQCAQRWRHRVNPNIKREKWTKLEDALLVRLVELHGNKWALIARNMPGRTDQQCMGRWRRHLDPTIRRDRWKPEEDLLLCALWKKYGNAWSQISKGMEGRTPQQCRTRHQHIEVNMKKWLEQNQEQINSLDVDEYERSRGFDGYTGARNAKAIVKKEGVQMRDLAAMMASKMRSLPDAATLEGDLVEELHASGGLPTSHIPSFRNDGSLLESHYQSKGAGLRNHGGGASTSASKGSTPPAANPLSKGYKDELDYYDNELPSFQPVDVSKILHQSSYFVDRLKPVPLSVESFQPAAALRLNESAGPGIRWDQTYLTNQLATQPFETFKNFAPFHQMTAPPREVGIGVNGASIFGGQDRPLHIAKPSSYPQKRSDLRADFGGTGNNSTGAATLPHSGPGHPGVGEPTAKRPRRPIYDWPNPDLEEEQRLREEGGLLQRAREQELMSLMFREGLEEVKL